MGRKNLSIKDIAEGIGLKRPTLSKKLKGESPLQLDEAYKILSRFFPEKEITYIFSEIFKEA
jgi:transcriptional regulator with XRE-family HTH domain